MRIWVARLRISPRVAQKIEHLHHVTAYEVRDVVECVRGLAARWDVDPERGARAIIQTRIRNQPALVVLYPTDDPYGDVWRLGSVYLLQG